MPNGLIFFLGHHLCQDLETETLTTNYMPKTAVLYYYDTVKAVISWPIPCVYYLDDFQYKMCCASARVFLLQIQTKMLGHKFH